MHKSRGNQDAVEQNGNNQNKQSDTDTEGGRSNDSFDLRYGYPERYFSNRSKSHVQKRKPLEEEKEGPDEQGVNEDTRIVNEQEDDKRGINIMVFKK